MSNLTLTKARLALLEAENKTKQSIEEKNHVNDLDQALADLSKCTELIPIEEERINKAIKKIEANKDEDELWKVKVDYLLWKLSVIKETYPKFEAEGKRRRALIDKVNKSGMWASEREKCAKDTHYWFENYAWTADPRKEGLWALPFNLYPFQASTVDWLEEHIFVLSSPCGIEKSRDMGLSWLISALFYKHFQHKKGFHALIGSITADECDTIGDPSSVFEKIRIQARMQPEGLLPRGWDRSISYMKAINPETGSTLTGSTSNADFGRSGRYSCILFDELSSFEADTEALTASSQSSPCKIYNSTVKGMGNEFARIRHEGAVPFLTLHWKEHPYKDHRWYEYEKNVNMTPVAVAQELDIDYSASQPNKVYPFWDEVYHTITKTELMTALPEFKGIDGQFHIPHGHKIVMGEDVGQSEGHANVLLWFLTLKDGSVTIDGIDLSGSIICYRELIMPPHSTIRQNAQKIEELEGRWESRGIVARYISHEGRWAVDNYAEYNIHYSQWRTDMGGNEGVSTIRDYLEVLNKDEPHPFRDLTRQVWFEDKKPIMGRPKIYFLSNDEQAQLGYDETLNKYTISKPEDSEGLKRVRDEFPVYHYPSSEFGKEPKKMRPRKIFDDCFVEGTMIYTNKGNRPIETLKSGDMVFTREGFKPVKDCVMTHKVSDIHRIEFSDGRFLEGTKTHPIFSVVDFFPMDVLRCGDRVTTLEETLWKSKKWLKQGKNLNLITTFVSFVGKNSNQERRVGSCIVPLVVKKKATDTGKKLPVWNLEVEECHEYFANGILVHNCMDVTRCVARESFAPVAEISFDKRIESQLPESLRLGNIEGLPPEELGMAYLQRVDARTNLIRQEEEKLKSWRQTLEERAMK